MKQPIKKSTRQGVPEVLPVQYQGHLLEGKLRDSTGLWEGGQLYNKRAARSGKCEDVLSS